MTLARHNKPAALLLLIAVQSLCAAFFVWDVVGDGLPLGWGAFDSPHFTVEALAALSLLAAVAFEIRYLFRLLRRAAHLQEQLGLAAGAFQDIIEARFRDWGLTRSEYDVALFTLKGMTIPEIARLRGSAEGTVKSHLNGIYRKADVGGRGAFLSLFIEDLMTALPADSAQAHAEVA